MSAVLDIWADDLDAVLTCLLVMAPMVQCYLNLPLSMPPSFFLCFFIYMYEIATYLKKIFRQHPIELRDFWVSFTHFSAYYDSLNCLCYSKASVKHFVRKAKSGS